MGLSSLHVSQAKGHWQSLVVVEHLAQPPLPIGPRFPMFMAANRPCCLAASSAARVWHGDSQTPTKQTNTSIPLLNLHFGSLKFDDFLHAQQRGTNLWNAHAWSYCGFREHTQLNRKPLRWVAFSASMRSFFITLKKHDITAGVSKCEPGKLSVVFLEFIISYSGISPVLDKVDAISIHPQSPDSLLRPFSKFAANLKHITRIDNSVADAIPRA